jgi:AcrR family transcriptional regulator
MKERSSPEKFKDHAREKLLDAAERMFGLADYDSVSTRAIAEEAGVNLAGIKYHFGGKEGLLEATIKRKLSRLVSFMREAAAEASDTDRLRHVFEMVMDRATVKEEGPYLEINYRVVLNRRDKKFRQQFHEEYVMPLNRVLLSAASHYQLSDDWKFLQPEDLVIILLSIPKFLKLFGDIFLTPEKTSGKSPNDLHQEGCKLAIKMLEKMGQKENR